MVHHASGWTTDPHICWIVARNKKNNLKKFSSLYVGTIRLRSGDKTLLEALWHSFGCHFSRAWLSFQLTANHNSWLQMEVIWMHNGALRRSLLMFDTYRWHMWAALPKSSWCYRNTCWTGINGLVKVLCHWWHLCHVSACWQPAKWIFVSVFCQRSWRLLMNYSRQVDISHIAWASHHLRKIMESL